MRYSACNLLGRYIYIYYICGVEVYVPVHKICSRAQSIEYYIFRASAHNTHQLVFALLKLFDNVLDDLAEVAALDEIVSLEENFTETTFTDGVVLEVEPNH